MSELLHRDADARALAVCRVGVFSLMVCSILGSDTAGLVDMPFEWFTPRGIFRCLPAPFYIHLLQTHWLLAIKFLSVALALLLIVGVRFYHATAVLFCGLFLLLQGLGKGFSATMNHMEMGMVFCSWALAVFPATDALALEPPGSRKQRPQSLYAAPMVFMTLVLSLFYTLLGVRRFIHGGLVIFTGDAIIGYVTTRSLSYSVTGHHWGMLALTQPGFAAALKAGFFLITLLEALSPLCLFHRGFRWLWLAVMIPFHISTLFTMNIFFKYNIVLILLLLTPVCRILGDRLGGHTGREAAATS